MTLASYTDANAHLDLDKVRFENDADAEPEALAADRYIRGRLTSVFDDVLLWDYAPTGSEVATPELVREIGGMWMAALRYEKKYSLEADQGDNYATRKKAEANALLDMLVSGDIGLVEVGVVSGVIFSDTDFWPNTTSETPTLNPKFYMDAEF